MSTPANIANIDRTSVVERDESERAPTRDQERLWLASKYRPEGAAAFNIGAAMRFSGPLDIASLRAALERVVRRHSSLRTAFRLRDGKLVRCVVPVVDVATPVVDLAGRYDAPGAAIAERYRDLVSRPFPLDVAPLWRTELLRCGTGEYALLFTAHHLVTDFRSIDLFFREVFAEHNRQWLGTGEPAVDRCEFADVDEAALRDLAGRQTAEAIKSLRKRCCELLRGTGALERIGDRPRPALPTYRGGSSFTTLPGEIRERLAEIAADTNVYESALYLSAFNILVAAHAGAERFVVGVPLDGRRTARMARSMGFLSVPSVFCARVPRDGEYAEMLARTSAELVSTLRLRRLPFSVIGDVIESEHGRADGPILPLLFSYITLPVLEDPDGLFRMAREHVSVSRTDVDLWLTVESLNGNTVLELDYSEDVFTRAGAGALLAAYVRILSAIARNPKSTIAQLLDSAAIPVARAEPEHAPLVSSSPEHRGPPLRIAVAATFTVDEIADAVSCFGSVQGRPVECTLAPYGQVLQSLLQASGALAENAGPGLNVVLLRLRDVFRDRASAPTELEIRAFMFEFEDVARNAAARFRIPLVVGVCPTPSAVGANEPDWGRLQEAFATNLRAIAGVSVVGQDEWLDAFELDDVHDGAAERLGHVPYSHGFFAVMGATLLRKAIGFERSMPKVVAVDCDNTLWRGVLGEDGVDGIRFDRGHLDLQRLLVRAQQAGVLICLCSKNDEDLVQAVFGRRPEMILRPEHIVSRKIGWSRKSDSLAELSRELNVALDSFVFLDDNDAEIAEVRSRLPQVVSIRVPQDPGVLGRFSRHLWALDVGKATVEDSRRTTLYREDGLRRAARAQWRTLEEFLQSLDLRVTFTPIDGVNARRASQLTSRTTQFNTTTIPRSEADIRAAAEGPGRCGWVVAARDRFGDYGIVGLVLVRHDGERFDVTDFLLSCRALGRGVEQEMVRHLAAQASRLGRSGLDILFKPTKRNAPARAFLEHLGTLTLTSEDTGTRAVRMSVEAAAGLRVQEEFCPIANSPDESPSLTTDRRDESEWMTRLATDLSTVAALLGLQPRRKVTKGGAESLDSGEAGLVSAVSRLFCEELGIDACGPSDDFFALGGTSLQAVGLLCQVERELGVALDLQVLLQGRSASAVSRAILAERRPATTLAPTTDACPDPYLADAQLSYEDVPPQVDSPPASAFANPRHVLLTGATGFVGTFVLSELLKRTAATIHCLVRADDSPSALERLERSFAEHGLPWPRHASQRVRPVPGDVGAPRLGLEVVAYDRLRAEVDSVIHCAAAVHFLAAYRQLRRANVEGTRAILAFAADRTSPKPVHYVSTLGVLHAATSASRAALEECDSMVRPSDLATGYQQTKWVAERLVSRARERGVSVSVYRLGPVAGDSRTGKSNAADLWSAVLGAAHRMGVMPRMARLDIVPVDWVAEAMLRIAMRPEAAGGVYHLSHPQPLPMETVERWNRAAGFGVRSVPVEDWLDILRRDLERDADHPLAPLAAVLLEPDRKKNLLCTLASAPPASTDNSSRQLGAAGFVWPALTQNVLATYYDALRDSGATRSAKATTYDERFMLWFTERMLGHASRASAGSELNYESACREGEAAGQRMGLNAVCGVENFRTLLKDRRIEVSGQLECSLIDEGPLTIVRGHWRIRPHDGVTTGGGAKVVFLQWDVEMVSSNGAKYWLRGKKLAEPGFDVWRQTTTLNVDVGRQGEPKVLFQGRMSIPSHTYVEDQIRGLHVSSRVPPRDHAKIRAAWLSFLGLNIGKNYLELSLRWGMKALLGS